MSPRKQPNSLFKLSVKTCISLINSACYVIEKSFPENKFGDCEREAYALKCHLMSMLPARYVYQFTYLNQLNVYHSIYFTL